MTAAETTDAGGHASKAQEQVLEQQHSLPQLGKIGSSQPTVKPPEGAWLLLMKAC